MPDHPDAAIIRRDALTRRQAAAYQYLIGELATLRVWARREKQLHVVTQLERLEYTAERLAQVPKTPLRDLGFGVVLETKEGA